MRSLVRYDGASNRMVSILAGFTLIGLRSARHRTTTRATRTIARFLGI